MDKEESSKELTRLAAAMHAGGDPGVIVPEELVRYAQRELAELDAAQEPLRVALVFLTLLPTSEVSRSLSLAAGLAYQRFRAYLRPYIDHEDFESRVRERCWRIKTNTLENAITHDTLVLLFRRVANYVALDEVRALERRPRPSLDPSVLESQPAETPDLDQTIDTRALLASIATDVPEWARDVLIALLADEINRDEALHLFNEQRSAHGLSEWSMGTMRVWLHRVRARLRTALADHAT